jgi:uncharacterized protein YhfF
MAEDNTEGYWRAYLDTLPEGSSVRDEGYTSDSFGDGPEMADRLGTLVADGTKTATCSALWEYEAEGDSIVNIGQKTIILDGNGDPLCIIETTEVKIRAYDQVDARFASEEGEGDLSLKYWREAHWNFFARTLPRIGRKPSLDMPLVCERFRVIHR